MIKMAKSEKLKKLDVGETRDVSGGNWFCATHYSGKVEYFVPNPRTGFIERTFDYSDAIELARKNEVWDNEPPVDCGRGSCALDNAFLKAHSAAMRCHKNRGYDRKK